MKKILYVFFVLALFNTVNAQGVFDSMDTASEVKLAPTVKATTSNSSIVVESPSTNIPAVNTVNKDDAKENTVPASLNRPVASIKEQKFNSALVNLDDAQVELRQELSALNARYTEALDEKERIVNSCKNLKKEIRAINEKMKNVEKSKKIINKNLENAQ